jgi:hypothetical protein
MLHRQVRHILQIGHGRLHSCHIRMKYRYSFQIDIDTLGLSKSDLRDHTAAAARSE